MTVAHKNLTGTDLHVVKGAPTATAGQVPIADGAGDAPFGKLTHESLQTTGNPFGAQLLHVREEQTSGTNSSTSAASGWNAQVLNTVKTNEITGASLAGSTITLPAGTYFIQAVGVSFGVSASSGGTMSVKARLRNTTAGTTILSGTSVGVAVGGAGLSMQVNAPAPIVQGRFTLAGATNIQLQAYVSSTSSATGKAFSGGETEVYAEVLIWKVA